MSLQRLLALALRDDDQEVEDAEDQDIGTSGRLANTDPPDCNRKSAMCSSVTLVSTSGGA